MTLLSNYVPILNLVPWDNAESIVVCVSSVGSALMDAITVVFLVASVKSVGIASNPL